MTERDSVTQVRGSQEATRGKGGKDKAVFKRGRGDTPSRETMENAKGRPSGQEQVVEPEVKARIQQRAYRLYEAGGFEHGHDLEHWLEAERQITGSSDRTSGS